MADLCGVGKPITYSDDNPVSNWIEELRKKLNAQKRKPKDDTERELLARWLGYRGRDELENIVVFRPMSRCLLNNLKRQTTGPKAGGNTSFRWTGS